MKRKVGSLYSGIGGLDLGLERAGFEIKWQVEIDDYAFRLLKQLFPNSEHYRDVRYFPVARSPWLMSNCVKHFEVDLICGGFPCQDISTAGKMAGIDGERSGLWSEFKRIIRFLRPKFVLVENVPALTVRGLDRVLGDLAEIGYSAEWRLLSAKEFGAPHLRKRIFIAAYPNSIGVLLERGWFANAGGKGAVFVDRNGQVQQMADADGGRLEGVEELFERTSETSRICSHVSDSDGIGRKGTKKHSRQECIPAGVRCDVSNANGVGCDVGRIARKRKSEITGCCCTVSNPESQGRERHGDRSTIEDPRPGEGHSWTESSAGGTIGWWSVEPPVGRMAYGVPDRVDRLRGTGNAILPQKGEFLGRVFNKALDIVQANKIVLTG